MSPAMRTNPLEKSFVPVQRLRGISPPISTKMSRYLLVLALSVLLFASAVFATPEQDAGNAVEDNKDGPVDGYNKHTVEMVRWLFSCIVLFWRLDTGCFNSTYAVPLCARPYNIYIVCFDV